MADRHHVQHDTSGAQIEIVERPYRQQMEHPAVEVTVWESIDDSCTILFEEVNPAYRRLEPAGPILGTLPRAAVTALEDLGYEVPA